MNIQRTLSDDSTPITVKLGCDVGNSFVNVVGELDYYRVFDSCLVENMGKDHEDGDNTIDYRGRNFTVSQGYLTAESVARRDLDKYEVLTIFGICRYLKDKQIDTTKREVQVHLGIGLPVGDYHQNRDIYTELFERKEVDCMFEGMKMTFKITEVRVVPQGTVVAYLNSEIFKGISLGYLIDIGSFTWDIQTVRNSEIVKNEKRSYELGTMRMFSEIGDVMKRLGAGFTNLKDIERALMNGYFVTENGDVGIDHPEIQEVIKNLLTQTVSIMKMEIGGLRNSNKTYIIGGGALLFGELLKDQFVKCEIAPYPEKLNAEAYYCFIGGR